MPRVKRATIALKKRRKLMKAVKGYRGARSRRVNCAQEAFLHAQQYAYRDRRNRKRDFRRLWITRITAACRIRGTRYSVFIHGIQQAGILLNRKMLSQIAIEDPSTFDELVKVAGEHSKQNAAA